MAVQPRKPPFQLADRHKALAALAVVVVVVAGWAYALASDLAAETQGLRIKETELQALQQRTQGRSGTAAAGRLGDPFLEGETLSLASNALQDRIVRLVEEAGGNVVSVNVEPVSSATPGQGTSQGKALMLQIAAEMAIDGVQRLLHRIETEAPAGIVDSLLVDRRTAGVAESDDPTRPTRLRIDARILGFARQAAP